MYHKSKVFQSSKDKSDFPSTAVDGNCMIMTVFSGQFGDLWVLPLDQACGMEHIFIYLTVSGRSRLKPGKADVSRLVKCYSRDCLLNSDGSRQKSLFYSNLYSLHNLCDLSYTPPTLPLFSFIWTMNDLMSLSAASNKTSEKIIGFPSALQSVLGSYNFHAFLFVYFIFLF